MGDVKCFHVASGRPCTRYLEGSKGERRQTVERIEKGIATAREFREANPMHRSYYDGMIDAFEALRDGIKAARLHEPSLAESEDRGAAGEEKGK